MSAPVFLAEASNLTAFGPGAIYLLDGTEGRHAGVVQRRGPGERIDVVDGAGVRLRCTVRATVDEGVELLVGEVVVEEPQCPPIFLVQALAKGDRDEMAVEAATETGADGFIPWQADRSIVIWRGNRIAKSHARWLATVRSATKQARRARMPRVEPVLDSPRLAERVRETCAAGGAVLLLWEEAETPILQAELPLPGSDQPVLVIVGPEGGVSDRELQILTQAGAQPVRLGPHILRTSTAGPVAISLLSVQVGHWT